MTYKLFLRKILSLVVVTALAFSFTSVATAETDEKQTVASADALYSEDVYNQKGNMSETKYEQLVGDINSAIKDFKEEVNIEKYNLENNTENMALISNIILSEIPECFHIDESFSIKCDDSIINAIIPKYEYTKSEYASMLGECETKAEELLIGIKDNNNLTTEEKLIIIHDRIALNCIYDPTTNQEDIPRISHTIYGVLGLGVAVCQGYALTYGYLLDKIGIKNLYCNSIELKHAWNIVYIDDIPYHVDVTWDDPVGVNTGKIYHENFLLSTDALRENDHDATDFDSTPSNTKYDNYFWRNIETAFVLAGDDIYYLDNQDAKIKRMSDNEAVVSVEDKWRLDDNRYWVGNFSILVGDGTDLIYTLSNAVYRYHVSTGTSRRIYSANLNEGENIFGFAIEDDEIVIEIANHPSYQSATKVETMRVPYSPADPDKPDYAPGDINDDGSVDNKDIVTLSQYMAGWEVYCNQSALDVNGDDSIDLKDVIHLAKVVAEWEGYVAH